MKHLVWDYHGYDDLKLELDRDVLQDDWNLTLYNYLCSVIDEDSFNIFCSNQILDIIKDNAGFNQKSMSLFDNRIRLLLFTTPKIYVTPILITDFTMIDHDNYGSVTVKNYVTY